MTWIKPSFLWMMYRSGWATKPGQERILAIDISRSGFEWALKNSCLTHFDARLYSSHQDWKERLSIMPVRIQWDPERNVFLKRLDYHTIQIGLSGEAVNRYVDEWISHIADITDLVKEINILAKSNVALASKLIPHESIYPVPGELEAVLGFIKTSDLFGRINGTASQPD